MNPDFPVAIGRSGNRRKAWSFFKQSTASRVTKVLRAADRDNCSNDRCAVPPVLDAQIVVLFRQDDFSLLVHFTTTGFFWS